MLYYCASYYPVSRLQRQITFNLMVHFVFPTIHEAFDWAAQNQIDSVALLKKLSLMERIQSETLNGCRAVFGESIYADHSVARHSGDCGYHS